MNREEFHQNIQQILPISKLEDPIKKMVSDATPENYLEILQIVQDYADSMGQIGSELNDNLQNITTNFKKEEQSIQKNLRKEVEQEEHDGAESILKSL